jgi:hypothetical protein
MEVIFIKTGRAVDPTVEETRSGEDGESPSKAQKSLEKQD